MSQYPLHHVSVVGCTHSSDHYPTSRLFLSPTGGPTTVAANTNSANPPPSIVVGSGWQTDRSTTRCDLLLCLQGGGGGGSLSGLQFETSSVTHVGLYELTKYNAAAASSSSYAAPPPDMQSAITAVTDSISGQSVNAARQLLGRTEVLSVYEHKSVFTQLVGGNANTAHVGSAAAVGTGGIPSSQVIMAGSSTHGNTSASSASVVGTSVKFVDIPLPAPHFTLPTTKVYLLLRLSCSWEPSHPLGMANLRVLGANGGASAGYPSSQHQQFGGGSGGNNPHAAFLSQQYPHLSQSQAHNAHTAHVAQSIIATATIGYKRTRALIDELDKALHEEEVGDGSGVSAGGMMVGGIGLGGGVSGVIGATAEGNQLLDQFTVNGNGFVVSAAAAGSGNVGGMSSPSAYMAPAPTPPPPLNAAPIAANPYAAFIPSNPAHASSSGAAAHAHNHHTTNTSNNNVVAHATLHGSTHCDTDAPQRKHHTAETVAVVLPTATYVPASFTYVPSGAAAAAAAGTAPTVPQQEYSSSNSTTMVVGSHNATMIEGTFAVGNKNSHTINAAGGGDDTEVEGSDTEVEDDDNDGNAAAPAAPVGGNTIVVGATIVEDTETDVEDDCAAAPPQQQRAALNNPYATTATCVPAAAQLAASAPTPAVAQAPPQAAANNPYAAPMSAAAPPSAPTLPAAAAEAPKNVPPHAPASTPSGYNPYVYVPAGARAAAATTAATAPSAIAPMPDDGNSNSVPFVVPATLSTFGAVVPSSVSPAPSASVGPTVVNGVYVPGGASVSPGTASANTAHQAAVTTPSALSAAATDPAKPLAGVYFVLSGYVNPQRSSLRDAAVALGAVCLPDWDPAKCTHLVTVSNSTPKYNQVVMLAHAGKNAHTVHVVNDKWITGASVSKTRPAESAFAVGLGTLPAAPSLVGV